MRAVVQHQRAGWNENEMATWSCEHKHVSKAGAGRCGIAHLRKLTRGTDSPDNVITYVSMHLARVLP